MVMMKISANHLQHHRRQSTSLMNNNAMIVKSRVADDRGRLSRYMTPSVVITRDLSRRTPLMISTSDQRVTAVVHCSPCGGAVVGEDQDHAHRTASIHTARAGRRARAIADAAAERDRIRRRSGVKSHTGRGTEAETLSPSLCLSLCLSLSRSGLPAVVVGRFVCSVLDHLRLALVWLSLLLIQCSLSFARCG